MISSMKQRSCQPCTACCEGWLSSRYIDMSPWRPCQHCTGKGCAIYAQRPQDPCRSFSCAWVRTGSELDDALRPDLCGAILLEDRSFQGWKVMIATPTGWKIPDDTLQALMQYARAKQTPLIYIENLHSNGVYSHFKRSGFGPREFVEAITRNTGVEVEREGMGEGIF